MVVSHLRSQFTLKISLLDLNKSSFAFPGCWVSLLILPVGSSDHYSEPFHLCHTGTMRHRRNGNFESSRLLCSSMSRSMDVSYNDSVSIRYILDKLGCCLGSGTRWLWNRSCQEKFDWFVSFPFMEFSQASEPSGNNGTLLTCWKSKGVCIPFDLYKFLLFIVSHFWFKILFHILVRDKSSVSVERNFHLFIWWQRLTTDNYIKIPFKPQSFADHSLAVFLLLLGLKVL